MDSMGRVPESGAETYTWPCLKQSRGKLLNPTGAQLSAHDNLVSGGGGGAEGGRGFKRRGHVYTYG